MADIITSMQKTLIILGVVIAGFGMTLPLYTQLSWTAAIICALINVVTVIAGYFIIRYSLNKSEEGVIKRYDNYVKEHGQEAADKVFSGYTFSNRNHSAK